MTGPAAPPAGHYVRMGHDASAPGRERRAVALDLGAVFQSGGEFWDQARARGDDTGRQLEAGMRSIWGPEKAVSDAWMRGELDERQVLARMGIDLTRPGLEDRLLRELDASIAALPVDTGLQRLVKEWREQAIVVLATDNVRSLELVFKKARAAGGKDGTLAGAAPLFDAVICSASEGLLKADPPPGGFFRSWAAQNALKPEDILLIDDREANCAAWRRAGGSAVCWEQGRDPLDELGVVVAAWLATDPAPAAGGPAGQKAQEPGGG